MRKRGLRSKLEEMDYMAKKRGRRGCKHKEENLHLRAVGEKNTRKGVEEAKGQ